MLSPQPLAGKKLGLLVSAPPQHPNFEHALRLADSALRHGLHVYLYCIDRAVAGIADPRLQHLEHPQLNLFACAVAARKYRVPLDEAATFCGLATLSDIMSGSHRFLSLSA